MWDIGERQSDNIIAIMMRTTSSDDDGGNYVPESQAPLQVLQRRQRLLLPLVTIRVAHAPCRLHQRCQALPRRRRPSPSALTPVMLLTLLEVRAPTPSCSWRHHPRRSSWATRSPSPSAWSHGGTTSMSPVLDCRPIHKHATGYNNDKKCNIFQ